MRRILRHQPLWNQCKCLQGNDLLVLLRILPGLLWPLVPSSGFFYAKSRLCKGLRRPFLRGVPVIDIGQEWPEVDNNSRYRGARSGANGAHGARGGAHLDVGSSIGWHSTSSPTPPKKRARAMPHWSLYMTLIFHYNR